MNFVDWNLISWSNVNKPVCDCNIISPPFCALTWTVFRQKIPAIHESAKSYHCRQEHSPTQSVYVTKDLFNMKFYYLECTEHIALCSALHQGHFPRCAVNLIMKTDKFFSRYFPEFLDLIIYASDVNWFYEDVNKVILAESSLSLRNNVTVNHWHLVYYYFIESIL